MIKLQNKNKSIKIYENLEYYLKEFYSSHKHESYITDFYYKLGIPFKNYFVGERTLRPEYSWASKYFSLYLFENRSFFSNKSVLDLGSGGGIQGFIALLFGNANRLVSLDISNDAIKSLKINKILLDIPNKKHKIIRSDLFKNLIKKEKFDVIIFNHPYINDIPKHPIDLIVKMPSEKFESFFSLYKAYLKPQGFVIMAYTNIDKKASNNPEQILTKKNIMFEKEVVKDDMGEHYFYIFKNND